MAGPPAEAPLQMRYVCSWLFSSQRTVILAIAGSRSRCSAALLTSSIEPAIDRPVRPPCAPVSPSMRASSVDFAHCATLSRASRIHVPRSRICCFWSSERLNCSTPCFGFDVCRSVLCPLNCCSDYTLAESIKSSICHPTQGRESPIRTCGGVFREHSSGQASRDPSRSTGFVIPLQARWSWPGWPSEP